MEKPGESGIQRTKQLTPREAIERFLSDDSKDKLSGVSEAILPLELPKYRDEFVRNEEGKLWYENYAGERETQAAQHTPHHPHHGALHFGSRETKVQKPYN